MWRRVRHWLHLATHVPEIVIELDAGRAHLRRGKLAGPMLREVEAAARGFDGRGYIYCSRRRAAMRVAFSASVPADLRQPLLNVLNLG